MTDSIYSALIAAGGSAVVSGALFAALWKFGSDSVLERFKRSQAEELERLKAYISLDVARAARFETAQFGAYQEVWSSLAYLRIAANRLWEHASQENLDDFGKHLEKARVVIYDTQLVIEQSVVNDLRGAIHAFEDFYSGKQGLVRLRQHGKKDSAAVAARIEENGHLRSRFVKIVEALRASLARQMHAPDGMSPPGV